MKTNPFDDSLRKKLVEVQPEFKEQDWENFQNYVRSQKAFNRTTQIWKQSKFWVGMAAASLLLTLSGICALLYQQNQLLKDELITLKEVLTRQPSANTPTRTDNLVPDETPVPLKNQLKLNQVDGKASFRTMYPLRDSQIQNYINNGRAKQINNI